MAAVVLPLPGPVLTMIKPRRMSAIERSFDCTRRARECVIWDLGFGIGNLKNHATSLGRITKVESPGSSHNPAGARQENGGRFWSPSAAWSNGGVDLLWHFDDSRELRLTFALFCS